jgi:hypothetical protein
MDTPLNTPLPSKNGLRQVLPRAKRRKVGFDVTESIFTKGRRRFQSAFVISVWRGASKGVDDGHRPLALQAGNPCAQAIPETAIQLFQGWREKVSRKKKVIFLGVEGKLILTRL